MGPLTRLGVVVFVLALMASGFGLGLAATPYLRPELRGVPPVERFVADVESAARRNCVLFTRTEGYEDHAVAVSRLRTMENSLASDENVEESATRIVGQVTLPEGKRVWVVASAARVCFAQPTPGVPPLPLGGKAPTGG